MNRRLLGVLVVALLAPNLIANTAFTASAQTAKPAPKPAPAKNDAEIKQLIINESIASYVGNCPCPFKQRSRRQELWTP